MREYLNELRELDVKIRDKSNHIKRNPSTSLNRLSEVKALKNSIYEKVSKTFVYNLNKLIKLEATQKNFAIKTGISEDLLSKYKSGGAFPSIETLLYICEVYNLSIDKLINIPLSATEIERLETDIDNKFSIFEGRYYVYFLVTNIEREGAIHEGIVDICNECVKFSIFSNNEIVKYFVGNYSISNKLIFFNLRSLNDGIAYINMIKPNINKNKYFGGLAMLVLPSDANSKPCAQKILFSKIKLDRELCYTELKNLLSFCIEEKNFDYVKISQWEDESAYNFILRQANI